MSAVLIETRFAVIRYLKRCSLLSRRHLSSVVLSDDDCIPNDYLSERIPKSSEEFKRRKLSPINQPDKPKLNKVSIIGLPNAGKSTLVNMLTGYRVTSVSKKVHTTRKNIIGVFTEGATQVELMDTPGLVKLKACIDFNLEHTMYHSPRLSAKVVDIVAVLVDVSKKRYRSFLDLETYKILEKHKDKESILILNKVDKISDKRDLLECVDKLTGGYIEGQPVIGREKFVDNKAPPKSFKHLIALTEKKLSKDSQDDKLDYGKLTPNLKSDLFNLYWPHFSRVFMISALNGDGVDELKNYLIETAKPSLWKYNEALVTNQDPKVLAMAIVREKFLENCDWDTPYLLKFSIDTWELDSMGNLHIVITALCPKNNRMASIIGPEGVTIAKVSMEARQELMDTFNCEVRMKIIVKCIERPKENKENEDK